MAKIRLTESVNSVYIDATTPFTEDGTGELSLGCSVDGMTILGMMGETQKLTFDESIAAIERFLVRSSGRVPAVASNAGLHSLTELNYRVMGLGTAGSMLAAPAVLRLDNIVRACFYTAFGQLGPADQAAMPITAAQIGRA